MDPQMVEMLGFFHGTFRPYKWDESTIGGPPGRVFQGNDRIIRTALHDEGDAAGVLQAGADIDPQVLS